MKQHGQKRSSQRLSNLTVYRTAEPYSPHEALHQVNFRPHFKPYSTPVRSLAPARGKGHKMPDTFKDEINRKHVHKPETI